MRTTTSRALVTLAAAVLAVGVAAVLAAQTLAAAQEAAAEYEWSIDLDCSLCHQAQAESLASADGEAAADDSQVADEEAQAQADAIDGEAEDADAPSGVVEHSPFDGYAIMHAEGFGLTCTSCHVDSEGLAKGHKKLNSGKEATRLKKSSVESDVCLACHDVEKLAQATADLTLLTDERGTTVNPHDLPPVEAHSDISCTRCHAVHDAEASLHKDASGLCTSCHHENVYECNTCHQ